MQMAPKANLVECKIDGSDVADCKKFHYALNELWEAVLESNVPRMTVGVEKVHSKWEILGARWPRTDRAEFESAAKGLDELKYWPDSAKQEIALLCPCLCGPCRPQSSFIDSRSSHSPRSDPAGAEHRRRQARLQRSSGPHAPDKTRAYKICSCSNEKHRQIKFGTIYENPKNQIQRNRPRLSGGPACMDNARCHFRPRQDGPRRESANHQLPYTS